MARENVQQKPGVMGIIFRARGSKALAVIGQCGGVNGEQDQMLVLGQHEYQRPTRLFQCHRHRLARKAQPELGSPDVHRFRRMIQTPGLPAGSIRRFQCPNMLLVSPVNRDKSSEFVFHVSPFSVEIQRAGLFPRRPYSRVLLDPYQTTSEYSFWKQSVPAARNSPLGHRMSGAAIRSRGTPALATLTQRPTSNKSAVFHSAAAATTVENLHIHISPPEPL